MAASSSASVPAALNLLSPDFDPELALTAGQVSVPFPDVEPLNSIYECRRLLPQSAAAAIRPEDERDLRQGSRHLRAADRTDGGRSDGADTSDVNASADSAASRNDTPYQQQLNEGPLGLLRRLRHTLVRVVVHRGCCLRGWVEGTLQVSDCGDNVVLRDAIETYVPLRDPLAAWTTRRVPQLLVRGQYVLSIAAVPAVQPSDAALEAMRARTVLRDPKGEASAADALHALEACARASNLAVSSVVSSSSDDRRERAVATVIPGAAMAEVSDSDDDA